MTTVDFTSWVTPNLVITLGGHTYEVRPPSVAGARAILACTVQSELSLGLAEGTLSDDMQAVLAELVETEVGKVSLGDTYDVMAADGIPKVDIDRVAYYALHYWARGKARADAVAGWLWGNPAEAGEPGPKAPSPSKSGRSTASASRTKKAGTRTTGSRST